MELNEVRQLINNIDEDMNKLFYKRMQCSSSVAEVKLANNDEIFKPLREKEICERYADDKNYLTFIKKVMQISRKHQYGMFIEKENIDEEFERFVADNKAFLEGGSLLFELKYDSRGEEGLGVHDILSIIADTSLEIESLFVTGEQVKVTFKVEDNKNSKYEAMVLGYMLYMETM